MRFTSFAASAAVLVALTGLASQAARAGEPAPTVSLVVTTYNGGYNWDYTIKNNNGNGGNAIAEIEIPEIASGDLVAEPTQSITCSSCTSSTVITSTVYYFPDGWTASGGTVSTLSPTPTLEPSGTAGAYILVTGGSIAAQGSVSFNFFSTVSAEATGVFDVTFVNDESVYQVDPPIPNSTATAAPEPGMLSLVAAGAGVLMLRRRRRTV